MLVNHRGEDESCEVDCCVIMSPILCFPLRGVGFSFIFSWLLMAIVATLFVVSGNTEKLVCEPLANRQLFKVPSSNSHPPTSSPFPFRSVCFGQGLFFSPWVQCVTLHNGQHCGSVLKKITRACCVCVCVFADHRYAIPGSPCQEELPPRHALPESKHWLDLRKHVQVIIQKH